MFPFLPLKFVFASGFFFFFFLREVGGINLTKPLSSILLTFTFASLVAQLVKNPPAMQETPVWFLGLEDPLEKG